MSLRDLCLGRRKDVRGKVCATASVTPTGSAATEHLVENLSAGGACLIGRAPAPIGAVVRVALSLPSERMELDARVVRTVDDGATPAHAVQFLDVPTRARHAIETEVLASLGRATRDVHRILVVEPIPARLERLLQMMRPLGDICLPATNLPDALWFMDRWKIQIGLLGLIERGLTPVPLSVLTERFPDCHWRKVGIDARLRDVGGVPVVEGIDIEI